jgi:uncharacterized beta-barrel protein YwiB (DUF1934 family)
MGDSNKVRIRLESIQDGSVQEHVYEGEWFRKAKSVFIRYIEPADESNPQAGEVRTLLRYRPNELSIVRRGAIESEQLFTPGRRQIGFYYTPLMRFALETDTLKLELLAGSEAAASGLEEGLPTVLPISLECEYDMLVSDQMSGRFHIRLYIQEEQ